MIEGGSTSEDLRRILSSCDEDSIEVMCHPAYVDNFLYRSSSYNIKRTYELDVLTSPEIMSFISERGIELCSFGEI